MASLVRFLRDFDHAVRFGVDVAYKAGTEDLIPDDHAAAAEAAGAIERLDRPGEAGEAKARRRRVRAAVEAG